jgi:hypothetical protein
MTGTSLFPPDTTERTQTSVTLDPFSLAETDSTLRKILAYGATGSKAENASSVTLVLVLIDNRRNVILVEVVRFAHKIVALYASTIFNVRATSA